MCWGKCRGQVGLHGLLHKERMRHLVARLPRDPVIVIVRAGRSRHGHDPPRGEHDGGGSVGGRNARVGRVGGGGLQGEHGV